MLSDIQGKLAKAMIQGLLNGETPAQVLRHADKRLKATEDELLDALDGELSPSHRFVVSEITAHGAELDVRIERFRQQLLPGLAPYQPLLPSLQTLPGIDETGAALLLVEIGDDRSAFGSAARLASWAGLCPGNNESADQRKSGKTRNGNPYVRRILCEAAHAASRMRCALQGKFKGSHDPPRAKKGDFCHSPQTFESRVGVDRTGRLLPGC